MFSFWSALVGVGIPWNQRPHSAFHFLEMMNMFLLSYQKSVHCSEERKSTLAGLWPLYWWSSESRVIPPRHWLYGHLFASDSGTFGEMSSHLCWASKFRPSLDCFLLGFCPLTKKEWIYPGWSLTAKVSGTDIRRGEVWSPPRECSLDRLHRCAAPLGDDKSFTTDLRGHTEPGHFWTSWDGQQCSAWWL